MINRIYLSEPMIDNFGINFIVETTEELIDIANEIRKRKGYNDLVSCYLDNDVYYNYDLYLNTKTNDLLLTFTCNHGENDDWCTYDIPLLFEEMNVIKSEIIRCLVKELEK